MGADPDGDIQHPLWDHFLPVPLLGRDDYISWHDNAYGDLVYDHMDPESFRRKRKCRKDPEAEPEAYHRAYYIRRDRTAVFYYILVVFDTPNIIFSTISIITSFLAAALTMLRSSYYAVWYAANDIVLIILWVLASMKNPAYIPVVVNFGIFFINDMYGYISWKRRERIQL